MSKNKVRIYHNPRCSKSRETLQILRDQSVEPTIIEYLQDSPDADEIGNLVKLLGILARDLIRTGESAYQEAKLDNPDLSEDEIIQAICDYPILLERPVVVVGNRAVIGRPPSRVLEIL